METVGKRTSPASHAMYVSTIHEERPGSHEAANFFAGGSGLYSVILAIDTVLKTQEKKKKKKKKQYRHT